MNLSEGNLTVSTNKKHDVEYEPVIGTVPISSGVHYWEIKIERFLDVEDIMIGVA
jgi:tripartite motif-containing protein 9/67